MESVVNRLFLHNWQRKMMALLIAAIIWFSVNQSITTTKTIPSVPIKVINLPIDKTIQGLLPNGFLSKRTTLTVSGTKDVVDQLEPGDIQVLIDVANQPNEGVVQITKKNLVSLNPNINLLNHITSVSHPELVIKMSSLLTEKIPILIHQPIGEAPKGYEYLDIWPIKLTQTVTGPQEQVLSLKNNGLELTFNLNDITKDQLDQLKGTYLDMYEDEVSFPVPEQWKKMIIPALGPLPEPLNDPEAKDLEIDFLRKEPIAMKSVIPVWVYYPFKYSETINPHTHPLISNQFIEMKNYLSILNIPLYVHNVSKLFLEVVKDHMEIQIVAAPKTEREKLEWAIHFVDHRHLEDTYVAFLLSNKSHAKAQSREKAFRQRFRHYMQKLVLYVSKKHKLEIDSSLKENYIEVYIPNGTTAMKSKKVS
jgi:hypothetical protein